MGNSEDLENIARQIADCQRQAMKCMERGYYSQNKRGKIDENAIREGQRYLNLAHELISENLTPFVEKTNPASLMEKALAAGLSYPAAANACQAINMYRSGAAVQTTVTAVVGTVGGTGTGMSTMALVGAGMAVVGAAILAVAIAMLCNEIYNHLKRSQKLAAPIVNHYDNLLTGKRKQHIPFQPNFMPRNA